VDPRRRDLTVELRYDDEPVTLISETRKVSAAGNLRKLKGLRPRGERPTGS
jgi:hypothetical protein